jgi:hypothetical protein
MFPRGSNFDGFRDHAVCLQTLLGGLHALGDTLPVDGLFWHGAVTWRRVTWGAHGHPVPVAPIVGKVVTLSEQRCPLAVRRLTAAQAQEGPWEPA